MLTLDALRNYGANVETGLSRCANMEALYLRLVKICIEELNSPALGDALKQNDINRAFEIAHKLKGGVANLALDPVAVPLFQLTELLRNKTPGDYDKLYGEISEQASILASLLN